MKSSEVVSLAITPLLRSTVVNRSRLVFTTVNWSLQLSPGVYVPPNSNRSRKKSLSWQQPQQHQQNS